MRELKDLTDTIVMLCVGIAILAITYGIKAYFDTNAMTADWTIKLMIGGVFVGSIFLSFGITMATYHWGSTVAIRQVHKNGLPSSNRRRLYTGLCYLGWMAIAITAINSIDFGSGLPSWRTAIIVTATTLGIAFIAGIAHELREIADYEEIMEEELRLATTEPEPTE